MNMTKENIQVIEETNQFIEQNKEDIILYLEKQLIQFRELFSSKVLNPWYLCYALNFEIMEKDNLDENIKTILRFKQATPYVYYNNKLNSFELNFYLMKEFVYYLITLYLPSEFKFKNFFTKEIILHSNTTDATKKENIIEKIVEDYALKFLIPDKIFNQYYIETNDIKKCSEYFRVEEKIIETILEHNKNNLKTLKKSR